MPCFVPFNEGFDLSFFAIRPTGVFTDELIDAMKYFSFHADDLGCYQSAVLHSLHGNLIIWYGAWIKRSPENKKILGDTLLSALSRVSDLAVVLNHGFFDPYAGESKDGRTDARFSTGDTLFVGAMKPKNLSTSGVDDLSYAVLALLKSCFFKMDGASAAVCLRCRQGPQPMVATLHVWRSLQECYAWLLTSDYRNTVRPYIAPLSHESHFDVFKVVYVSTDEVPSARFTPLPTISSNDNSSSNGDSLAS